MLRTVCSGTIIPSPASFPAQVAVSAVEEHLAGSLVLTLRIFAETMVNALFAKCASTYRHSQRVAVISFTAAHGLGLKKKQADYYFIAGLLHDIGTIGLPDVLLGKMKQCDRLTSEEEIAMRQHMHIGAQVIAPVDRIMSTRDTLGSIIMHHHECYDGTGYPGRLRGSRIPFGARIVGCADALAIRLEKGDSFAEALEFITARDARKYDPQVVCAIQKYRSKAELCLKEISRRRKAS